MEVPDPNNQGQPRGRPRGRAGHVRAPRGRARGQPHRHFRNRLDPVDAHQDDRHFYRSTGFYPDNFRELVDIFGPDLQTQRESVVNLSPAQKLHLYLVYIHSGR